MSSCARPAQVRRPETIELKTHLASFPADQEPQELAPKMERFVALTILIVLLPPCRTASDCSPQCNVHANQSQWPVSDESTTDVSEIVYLRCFTACSDEVGRARMHDPYTSMYR